MDRTREDRNARPLRDKHLCGDRYPLGGMGGDRCVLKSDLGNEQHGGVHSEGLLNCAERVRLVDVVSSEQTRTGETGVTDKGGILGVAGPHLAKCSLGFVEKNLLVLRVYGEESEGES